MSKQKDELTPLQKAERWAVVAPFHLAGSEDAIRKVVSALRSYRALLAQVIEKSCTSDAMRLDLAHERDKIENLDF
jgi:hypothetical protein